METQSNMLLNAQPGPRYWIGSIRLLIGLMQGGALWFLHNAFMSESWPVTDEKLYSSFLTLAFFLPILALAGVGNLRSRTLAPWLAAAAVLCSGLGWYWTFRHVGVRAQPDPWLYFYPGLLGLLLVAHSLVAAADADRKPIASAATYFDVTCKVATSLVFAILFAVLLRAIFQASAGLFALIGIVSVGTIIDQNWFWIPTTTVAIGVAFHLTDDRSGRVRSAAKLLFGLLSWLLLPAVVIGLAFLGALPFTGLDPLWNTRHATASLLAAAIVLILLIRAHFQDDAPDTVRFWILVQARLVAALLLVPIVVLAGIGLALRVAQYGWMPTRIMALACLIVVACHAVGYCVVVVRSGRAMRGLALANAVSAAVTVCLGIALMTPVADPARLSVADQIGRLESGKVPPDQFDYWAIGHEGLRYGLAALQRLKANDKGPNAADIAKRAADALARL